MSKPLIKLIKIKIDFVKLLTTPKFSSSRTCNFRLILMPTLLHFVGWELSTLSRSLCPLSFSPLELLTICRGLRHYPLLVKDLKLWVAPYVTPPISFVGWVLPTLGHSLHPLHSPPSVKNLQLHNTHHSLCRFPLDWLRICNFVLLLYPLPSPPLRWFRIGSTTLLLTSHSKLRTCNSKVVPYIPFCVLPSPP
jgi:hypothetical protein